MKFQKFENAEQMETMARSRFNGGYFWNIVIRDTDDYPSKAGRNILFSDKFHKLPDGYFDNGEIKETLLGQYPSPTGIFKTRICRIDYIVKNPTNKNGEQK